MFTIQPFRGGQRNKELRPVGIGTGIGTTQHARLMVFVQKILIGKGRSMVDGCLAGSIVIQEITALNHKAL